MVAKKKYDLEYFSAWDEKLVSIAKNFKILSVVAWPYSIQQKFLSTWKKKRPEIPKPQYPKYQFKEIKKTLTEIFTQINKDHPMGKYIADTAESYFVASQMLENLGQPVMKESSIHLYGKPKDKLHGSVFSSVDAAKHFIQTAEEFSGKFNSRDYDYCIPAEIVKKELENKISRFFKNHEIKVVVDANLASKASASTNRIRLRKNTSFTEYDIKQLWEHEALVHSLTGINGKEQLYFKSMGYGSPRTTSTQEGIATFAELITGTMDLSRLKRIAERIVGIQMGLDGANFIEVFKYFLESGQNEMESYQSAMRVFRGGDPRGKGVVFTKDSVYMNGLFNTHTFFRKSMHEGHIFQSEILFCGRLTFSDVEVFEPFTRLGWIQKPQYLPYWIKNIHGLAAYLAFAIFANKIRVDKITNLKK